MKLSSIFLGFVIAFFVNLTLLFAAHPTERHRPAMKENLPVFGANMPPGLQQHGMPKGLGKTPYGWTKGEKIGWNQKNISNKHGLGTVKNHKKK
ncbi:hypothetical protein A8135_11195 [Legionella jamestowniensis]|uniref:Uncharacterized protein n=1 Tax=Legionella jamestowniensis TaxID=455 RepID=A0ABX2Y096_9GAMM|nr:hypothetical protein [Legionella jamestowniensis]OCH98641.1 hypothetical protein A8135_11195 [Legionella jamestowniensis]